MKLSDMPWIDHYPPLIEWLREHDAVCMWQASTDGNGELSTNASAVECWRIGAKLVLVVIHPRRMGWEIYTSSDSALTSVSLKDVEERLGLTK